ncbi:MAG TPA: DoxX family protein [Candidatus Nanoarchaeia archaeon]|nr:DoxX family protein [Candidatus Nanoarchaeia archaeon]
MTFGKLKEWSPLVLRIALAGVLIAHGWSKYTGGVDKFAGFVGNSFPAATFFAWLVTGVELVGGLAILLGLWTRAVALLVAGQFLIINLYVKWGAAWFGGGSKELDVLVMAIGLSLLFTGAGSKLNLEKKWLGTDRLSK